MSCYTKVDYYLSKVIPVVVPVISKQILKCLHKFLRGNFCIQWLRKNCHTENWLFKLQSGLPWLQTNQRDTMVM